MRHLTAVAAAPAFPILSSPPKLWVPRRVLATRSALSWQQGRVILQRAAARGADVVELKTDRLPLAELSTYAAAKTTLAVVVASKSRRRPQPIPPSADWQFHLAEGCPAHCQYCYLAGSLKGPPVTRVYANLPEILHELPPVCGNGTVTSQSRRADEGTTYEASCYTDPLGLEHLTGSLEETIRFFGAWDQRVQLRFTTKFSGVEPLLPLAHNGRTRIRFSVNSRSVVRLWEGGTASLDARISALRRMAEAGYPIGLTVAPIVAVPGWQDQYGDLFADVSRALKGVSADLTVEMITHRFTPGSKNVLSTWYPKTTLNMEESTRAEKPTKFGGSKFVYPAPVMRQLRTTLESSVALHLPSARILYWT